MMAVQLQGCRVPRRSQEARSSAKWSNRTWKSMHWALDKGKKVLPRFELGLPDSESDVLTTRPQDHG